MNDIYTIFCIGIRKMPYTFGAILIFFTATKAFGQDTEIVYLGPSNRSAPNVDMVQHFDSTDRILKITKVDRPNFKVYRPQKEKNNGTAIIICPGGGYYLLAADLEGYEIAEWLSSLGYTAFVLHYKVPDNRTAALKNLQEALSNIRKNHKRFGIKKDQIGVMGFSAGGHLAARADSSTSPSKPNFTILIYAAYLAEEGSASLAEEVQIDSASSPTFLFATADDPHTYGSLVLTEKLRKNKVPVELHILAEGGHGYGMRPGNLAAEKWPALLEVWLDQQIKK